MKRRGNVRLCGPLSKETWRCWALEAKLIIAERDSRLISRLKGGSGVTPYRDTHCFCSAPRQSSSYSIHLPCCLRSSDFCCEWIRGIPAQPDEAVVALVHPPRPISQDPSSISVACRTDICTHVVGLQDEAVHRCPPMRELRRPPTGAPSVVLSEGIWWAPADKSRSAPVSKMSCSSPGEHFVSRCSMDPRVFRWDARCCSIQRPPFNFQQRSDTLGGVPIR